MRWRAEVLKALESKAPGLYASLRLGGDLESFVAQRAHDVHEAICIARSRLMEERKSLTNSDYLTRAREMAEIDRLSKEVVLSELLEFPREPAAQ